MLSSGSVYFANMACIFFMYRNQHVKSKVVHILASYI
jgi:hypothetical protein